MRNTRVENSEKEWYNTYYIKYKEVAHNVFQPWESNYCCSSEESTAEQRTTDVHHCEAGGWRKRDFFLVGSSADGHYRQRLQRQQGPWALREVLVWRGPDRHAGKPVPLWRHFPHVHDVSQVRHTQCA